MIIKEEKELLVNKRMASEATGHQENEDRDGGRLEMSREQFPLENFPL